MSEETEINKPWEIIPEVTEDKKNPETQETIQDTKQELAEAYLNFLDQQKGGVLAAGAGLGINLNPFKQDSIDYLTSDTALEGKKNIFSNFGKNFKKNLMEKFTGWTALEYDKASLNKMKALILQHKDNQAKLQELMAQIKEGVDPTTIDSTVAPMTNIPKTDIESNDKPSRAKVLASLQTVLEQDKKAPIDYLRWGKTDPTKGLDCSGLIYYTLNQAWLKMPGGDSRSMFKSFDTKKLAIKEETHSIATDVSDIKEGDIVFWNSTNPDYHRSTWKIPSLEKDGINYRIHHVAFIKSIDVDKGIVNVVESNWSQGVTESEIDITKQLTGTDHKSELYVAHINYDDFEKYDKLAA